MDLLGKKGREVTLEKSVILEVITTFLTLCLPILYVASVVRIRGLRISMEHGNFKIANYQGNSQISCNNFRPLKHKKLLHFLEIQQAYLSYSHGSLKYLLNGSHYICDKSSKKPVEGFVNSNPEDHKDRRDVGTHY